MTYSPPGAVCTTVRIGHNQPSGGETGNYDYPCVPGGSHQPRNRGAELRPVAYPGILKGTGHCTKGRMFIDGRWAPQIGNWLIRRFFHAELHSKVSEVRVGRVLIYVRVKCDHASPIRRLDGCPNANGQRCPECPYVGYATGDSVLKLPGVPEKSRLKQISLNFLSHVRYI